jgi:hypothetical protein
LFLKEGIPHYASSVGFIPNEVRNLVNIITIEFLKYLCIKGRPGREGDFKIRIIAPFSLRETGVGGMRFKSKAVTLLTKYP